MACDIDWARFLNGPAARTALAWEQAAFARFVASKMGDRALQIGLVDLDPFSKSPIGHRIVLTQQVQPLSVQDLRVQVLGLDWALPFASESCDVVAWPHGADLCGDRTAQALQEIARVLTPNGLLVTTFFNPWGSWKLREKLLGARACLPKAAAQISLSAMKAHIVAAGLRLEGGNFGVYAIDRNTAGKNASCRLPTWVDKAGDRWWPTLSNVVLLSARKHTPGVNLVGKVNFQRAKSVKAAAVVQSHRSRT